MRPERRADRKQDRIAEPAADQQYRFARWRFGRRSGWSHQDYGLARLEKRAEVGRAAHLQHDRRQQPRILVEPGAGQSQPFHRQGRPVDP